MKFRQNIIQKKVRDPYRETKSKEERRFAGRRHLKKLNDLKEEMKYINEELSADGKKMAGYKIPPWQQECQSKPKKSTSRIVEHDKDSDSEVEFDPRKRTRLKT